jgi:hypothetical protein
LSSSDGAGIEALRSVALKDDARARASKSAREQIAKIDHDGA